MLIAWSSLVGIMVCVNAQRNVCSKFNQNIKMERNRKSVFFRNDEKDVGTDRNHDHDDTGLSFTLLSASSTGAGAPDNASDILVVISQTLVGLSLIVREKK